jgi:hypothetical protein
MTLENLGPLLDELCAVLHGKGCTVREVAITYAPLVPEEAHDPGSSCSRVDTASTLPPPREDTRRHDSAGTVHTSRLVCPSWRERPQERQAFEGGDPQRASHSHQGCHQEESSACDATP